MQVEQAVFTSIQSDRSCGYHVVSRSAGISESDARELVVWGPSHDALAETGSEAASTNFFSLSSGSYCVSRTTTAGGEYSARGGPRVYTQCLVISAEGLARFANNPFAVLRAATASGAIVVHEQISPQLEPIRLGGRAAPVDLALLAQLAINPGPLCIAVLVEQALASERLALVGGTKPDQLIAGLINCLPVPIRPQYSFSTGLKLSPSRPFRLMRVAETAEEHRRHVRQADLELVDVVQATLAAQLTAFSGWAGFVADALSSGKAGFLAAEIGRVDQALTSNQLDQLGEELRRQLASGGRARRGSAVAPIKPSTRHDGVAPTPTRAGMTIVQPAVDEANASIADAPHPMRPRRTAQLPGSMPRAHQELLERIDDLVFSVISGQSEVLSELESHWSQARTELEPDLLETSREQYLRCALSIWMDVQNRDRRPDRAAAALDVLCLLFGE